MALEEKCGLWLERQRSRVESEGAIRRNAVGELVATRTLVTAADG